jgi:hypothetical protein
VPASVHTLNRHCRIVLYLQLQQQSLGQPATSVFLKKKEQISLLHFWFVKVFNTSYIYSNNHDSFNTKA